MLKYINEDSTVPRECMQSENVKTELCYEIKTLVNRIYSHFTKLGYDDEDISRVMANVYWDIHEAIREENNLYAAYRGK